MLPSDPVVTASIYAAGRLDRVVAGVVAPALERMRAGASAGAGVWFVRYARGGEHLKLRLHAPAEHGETLREILSEFMCSLRAALEPLPAEARGVFRSDVPAVDAEDDTETDHPDLTLRWTTYRRSPVSLGPAPLLDDDGYVARLVGSLAASAERAIAALAEGEAAPAVRQRALLRLVVEGIAALPLAADERAAYAAYHRDWLLRFFTDDPEREGAARRALEARGERMAGAAARLRDSLEAAAAAPPPAGLPAALAELHRYCGRFAGDPRYDVDPFAAGAAFPALFKALHGAANQLGVHPLEEAFAHHLVLCAAGAGAGAVG